MSHILGKLLNSKGSFFDNLIYSLEQATGNQAIDVNIVGKILTDVNLKLRELNFTPGDVTSQEAERALIAKYETDSEDILRQLLGTSYNENQLRQAIIDITTSLIDFRVLHLSDRSIIKLLNQQSPKRTLDRLRLKSTEELLSQYDVYEIFTLVNHHEDENWLNELKKQISLLPRGYFELQPLKVKMLTPELEEVFSRHRTNYFFSKGSNAIYFKTQSKYKHDFMAETVMMALFLRNIIYFSNTMAIILQAATFQQNLLVLLNEDFNFGWSIAGNLVSWRSVYEVIVRENDPLNSKIIEHFPELKDRLVYFDPYQKVISLFDELHFWNNTSELALYTDDSVVSMNLFDVIFSASKTRPRVNLIFEENLWNLMIARYLSNEKLTNQLFLQFKKAVMEK